MPHETYQFQFQADMDMTDVEESLQLALIAVESLHGHSEMLLGTGYSVDAAHRTVLIDGNTRVARHLCRLFCGFISREFGDDVFAVERFTFDAPPAAVAPPFTNN